jgi:hypothetical protein
MAQRCMRAVCGGQRSVLGAEGDDESQSGVGERSAAVAGRGDNGLLLRTDSERRRCTGRRLHALRVEAGRQVAHIRVAAGAVRTLRWRSASACGPDATLAVGLGARRKGSWRGRDAALMVGISMRLEQRPGARAQDQRPGAI